MTEREPIPMPMAFAVEAIACAMTPGALLDGCCSVDVDVVLLVEIKGRSGPPAMKCRYKRYARLQKSGAPI